MAARIPNPLCDARSGERAGPGHRPGGALGPPAAALVLGLLAIGAPVALKAQPAPSFQSSCAELRPSIDGLEVEAGELVTIEVVGTLTMVRFDGALAYLAMCEPPHPQVLCVTYSTGGRKPGDEVVLAGSYYQKGPDHVLLDPCLHYPPE